MFCVGDSSKFKNASRCLHECIYLSMANRQTYIHHCPKSCVGCEGTVSFFLHIYTVQPSNSTKFIIVTHILLDRVYGKLHAYFIPRCFILRCVENNLTFEIKQMWLPVWDLSCGCIIIVVVSISQTQANYNNCRVFVTWEYYALKLNTLTKRWRLTQFSLLPGAVSCLWKHSQRWYHCTYISQ